MHATIVKQITNNNRNKDIYLRDADVLLRVLTGRG